MAAGGKISASAKSMPVQRLLQFTVVVGLGMPCGLGIDAVGFDTCCVGAGGGAGVGVGAQGGGVGMGFGTGGGVGRLVALVGLQADASGGPSVQPRGRRPVGSDRVIGELLPYQ